MRRARLCVRNMVALLAEEGVYVVFSINNAPWESLLPRSLLPYQYFLRIKQNGGYALPPAGIHSPAPGKKKGKEKHQERFAASGHLRMQAARATKARGNRRDVLVIAASRMPLDLAGLAAAVPVLPGFDHPSCSTWTDDREELDWQSMQD